jgi:hypothetical protein
MSTASARARGLDCWRTNLGVNSAFTFLVSLGTRQGGYRRQSSTNVSATTSRDHDGAQTRGRSSAFRTIRCGRRQSRDNPQGFYENRMDDAPQDHCPFRRHHTSPAAVHYRKKGGIHIDISDRTSQLTTFCGPDNITQTPSSRENCAKDKCAKDGMTERLCSLEAKHGVGWDF